MTVDELIQLPGVGRKTANVITSVVDAQPNMAVDTHVFRVSARLGLTINAKTPLAVERQLVQYIPTGLIHKAHHWLILHGRYTCIARNPKCGECGLKTVCKYYQAQQKKSQKIPFSNKEIFGRQQSCVVASPVATLVSKFPFYGINKCRRTIKIHADWVFSRVMAIAI